MARLDGIFDRSGRVRRPPYSGLLSEVGALLFHHPPAPDPLTVPEGDGHTVLIVPAFLTNDLMTVRLHRFLARCGYRPHGWGLGVNWGPTPGALRGLRERFDALVAREGGPISVVGVSLGGLLARDLAHDRPRHVRQVITLASPFCLPTATPIEPLFHLCAAFYSSTLRLDRLDAPLPVPSTAIFTRDDGLVPWESCRHDSAATACVEVSGRHLTIGRNPDALRAVAFALASTRR